MKRGIEAKVADIKDNLAQWLEETARSSEGTAITIALLETALDPYLVEHTAAESEVASADADALDPIKPVLRRAVQRRRVALRLNALRKERLLVIPTNDEELANHLTEMLNLLDALAASLPKDAALRQFIDTAAGPLGALLGYFVGGPRPDAEHLHRALSPVSGVGGEDRLACSHRMGPGSRFLSRPHRRRGRNRLRERHCFLLGHSERLDGVR